MTAARSTDHVARARGKILSQFRRSPILRAIVSIRARRWQEIEDAAWEVADAQTIEGAIGVGLDQIGTLVGRGRNDALDALYRIALRAQIRINRAHGKIRDTLDVLVLSTGGTAELSEPGPAAYVVSHVEALAAGEAEALAVNLRQVRPLGVKARLSTTRDATQRARYGSRSAPALDTPPGYGFTGDPSVGGTYSHGRAL